LRLWTILAIIGVTAALIALIAKSLQPAEDAKKMIDNPASAASSQATPPPQRANPVISTNSRTAAESVVNEIVFECLSCRALLKSVVCDLNVKNDSSAEKNIMLIGFGNGTRMFDEVGNGYSPSRIEFGNEISGRLELVSLMTAPNATT